MQTKKLTWVGFLLLCLLRASAWILPSNPDSLPAAEQQAILYGVAGVVALLFARRRLPDRLRTAVWAPLSIASVGLFGLPVVLMGWAQGSVTEIGISALFAAVPVVVAMVMATGTEGAGRRFLTPALVAFGGALLLLPVSLPGPLQGNLRLAGPILAILLVGISSVRMFRLLQPVAYPEALAVVGLSNATFLTFYCIANRSFLWRWNQLAPVASIASLIDLIELLLLVWLLREMPPIRLSARYLLIPLFTVIEGYIILRPQITARLTVGAALLTAGAAWILFARMEENEPVLSLH